MGGISFLSVSGRFNNEEVKSLFDSISNGTNVDMSVVWVSMASIFGIAMIVSSLITIFLRNPFSVSLARFFYMNREKNASFDEIKHPFKKERYLKVVGTLLLKDIIVSLFSLLLIIPGIIKAYDYYMVDFILAEDPTLSPRQALQKSKYMMRGYRWSTFVLNLSFLPWHFLAVLTFGVLTVFYVAPYVTATDAELYYALKSIVYPEEIVNETEGSTSSDNLFDDNSKDESAADETHDSDDGSDLFE